MPVPVPAAAAASSVRYDRFHIERARDGEAANTLVAYNEMSPSVRYTLKSGDVLSRDGLQVSRRDFGFIGVGPRV